MATNIPKPNADRLLNASDTTSDNTDGMRAALTTITIRPPTR